MQFTFASCIYVLGCGHSCGVRANRVAALGTPWHCVSCDSDQAVTDVVTLGDTPDADD